MDNRYAKFSGKKGNLKCSYCHGTNHTKDRCYHLIGFPPRNNVGSNRFFRFSPTNSTQNKLVAQVQSGNDITSTSGETSHSEKDTTLSVE